MCPEHCIGFKWRKKHVATTTIASMKYQKTQKPNQAKAQNANKWTKLKKALKKHLSGKK